MIIIPQHIADAMISHAQAELPDEACGLLTGTDNVAQTFYPMTNIDHSPEHFSFDPQEQFRVLNSARANGQKIIANYHSHPSTPARPSQEDIRLAFDPNIVYIIISLSGEIPEMKAFVRDEGSDLKLCSILYKTIKVVCRNSPLSLVQVKEVFSLLPGLKYDLLPVASFGDKNKHISLLDGSIAADFFTRELDEALLNNEADIAVHSAKDLPYPLPSGLELYCLTEAADKTDALACRRDAEHHVSTLPAGARVGTSSNTRRTELLNLRPDVAVVDVRGTIEERIAQVDSGYIDALIVATCAMKRLGLQSRIAEILHFKTHPLQGNLAVVGRKNNTELKTIFSPLDIRKGYGKVWLVGFGPGNPDLLTLGGDKALAKADIIFYDDLIDKEFIKKYKAEKVYVGKRKDKHSHHQDEVNKLLYQSAIAGKSVVRLKGGDPMIFAHGREELDFLQSRLVEVQIISGISSGIALSAFTHIPLTCRGVSSSVAFAAGHSSDDVQIPNADTLVYYMAGANISAIAQKLLAAGRSSDTPVALVHNVSLPDQKTFFSSLKELQFSVIRHPTPILVIVGNVVSFENGNRQNILVTGTTAADYAYHGNIVHTPLIEIARSKDNTLFERLEEQISAFDFIVFTSRYGVRFFFEIADEIQLDIRKLGNMKIASVGKTTTAELNQHHIYPDIEPETQSAEGLIQYFKEINLTGKNILLPRSDKGLKYLSDELRALKNRVVDLPVYTNTNNHQPCKVDVSLFEKIIFSSPSGVDAFMELYGEIPSGTQLVARGKTTENKLKKVINETFQII